MRVTRPFTPAEIRQRKRVRASQRPPDPGPTHLYSTLIEVDRAEPPGANIRVGSVSRRGSRATWRIDVELTAGASQVSLLAPPTERRVLTPALRKRVRGRSDPAPLRPKWANLSYVPTRGAAASRMRLLRKGRELDPLLVFPPDGRFVYNDLNYPWRCVGRIESGGTGGSGVLIGPRHVLTASHVLDWSNLWVKFTAHLFDNTNAGWSFASKVWHYEKLSDVNSENVEQDYAVVVLYSPLGSQLGYLGAREYYDDWDGETYWSSIGYTPSMGGGDRPLFQGFFALEEEDGGDMMVMSTTTGDFQNGQSGSAVFAWWPQGPYAVGVASSGGQGKNWISGGEALVDLVKIARDEDP